MTSDITDTIARVREGLEDVTPGPWIASAKPSSVVGWPIVAGTGRVIADVNYVQHTHIDPPVPGDRSFNAESKANARHIANCDPGTIRALLDEIERLSEPGFWGRLAANVGKKARDAEARAGKAEAELARLRAPVEGEAGEMVERLGYHSEHPVTGKLVLTNPLGPAAADLITRQAARIEEVEGERDAAHVAYSELMRLRAQSSVAAEARLREAREVIRIGRLLVPFGFEKGDVTAAEFKAKADAWLDKEKTDEAQ